MSHNKELKAETRWAPKITFPSAVFLLIALWIYALAWAWSGHPIYRDLHMGAALEYASNGIDLLRPVIAGFNANGTGKATYGEHSEFARVSGLRDWILRLAPGARFVG